MAMFILEPVHLAKMIHVIWIWYGEVGMEYLGTQRSNTQVKGVYDSMD